ncbi:hypothetical protein PHSY_005459 [Pseudozyma hubeiensis SY62]|uniref:Guanine nucleotide exchange factor n=1 Tax=Pseudozyma hubeiensis (strain SY62) TaxID=1305764 RepID=R9P937_PSEHS|nr:hypothetical protein PHSY_005459 [Pseudozyma hubeiensis SY62]GAC97871.1 hypothetical protein PHSY_005459 [Pseudozyma hubeiensis SY62]
MASSSVDSNVPTTEDPVESKTESLSSSTEDDNTTAEEASAPKQMEESGQTEEVTETTTEALADDVDRLALHATSAHVGKTDSPSKDAADAEAKERQSGTNVPQTHTKATAIAADEAVSASKPDGEAEPAQDSLGAAEDSEATKDNSPSAAPASAPVDKKSHDSSRPPQPVAVEEPVLASDQMNTATAGSGGSANEASATSQGRESVSPPTLPSKDAPQLPEKTTANDTRPSTAEVDTSTTPATPQPAKPSREALADADSVAAVAHAFGRDSPAIRSPLDTPQRISTPVDRTNNDTGKAKMELDDDQRAREAATRAPTKEANQAQETAEGVAESERVADASTDKGAPRGGIRIGKGPPPTTQASEEVPFDFNRFLEQMKHRSAQPVGEYVRSFIKGFSKKPYRTQDQIKLIFDFLDFIAARMRECDVWKNLGDTDFENAKEAMEKLVMNRLYPYTFTPAVHKEGRWAVQTDDLERDRVLRQRIGLFGWLSEEHLDVPVGDHSRGFIEFSIQELLKINHYKAPRDKLICILNCCKVIFGMIRHLSSQENADTFIPVLIFVVLKANPEHLISNVEYISRFRNPDRLSSESGYYLSSLMGAIAFIETMDYTSLSNITQEEFEKRVEEAVSSLPEPEASTASGAASGASEASLLAPPTTPPPRGGQPAFGSQQHQRSVSATSVSAPSGPGEEAAKALPFTPMAATLADDTRAFFLRTGEAARTGLSRPMGALGRLFNEGIEGIRTPSQNDSGASTERQNSPAPSAGASSSTALPASTSGSKLFGGLFGSLNTSDSGTQARGAGYPGQGGGRRSLALMDDEPQTPSTGELTQDGFQPYPGAQIAPPRLLRPNMPQRNYSIDDTMFDDESAGRRNLMATTASGGRGQRDADYYDDEDDQDDDDLDASRSTPNAAAAEQLRRRMQMQHDFGRGFDAASGHDVGSTPSRRGPEATDPQGRLRTNRRDEIAYEHAQTEQAIQRSLIDQERLGAVQADQAAQNSASVETLKSIFPTMDDGVIHMVLQGCEGNVETAIDRLLEMQ